MNCQRYAYLPNCHSSLVQLSERQHSEGDKRHLLLLYHYRHVVKFKYDSIHELDHKIHNC